MRYCDFAPTIACDAVKVNIKGEKMRRGSHPRLVFGGSPPTGRAGVPPAQMEDENLLVRRQDGGYPSQKKPGTVPGWFAAKMAAIPVRGARFPKVSHG